MARTVNTVQSASLTGVVPTFNAATATDGNSFANSGNTIIVVKNDSVASIDVTLPTPGTVDGVAISDPVVAVGASEQKVIGPFSPLVFNHTNGTVWLDFSAVTSVTFAVIKLR